MTTEYLPECFATTAPKSQHHLEDHGLFTPEVRRLWKYHLLHFVPEDLRDGQSLVDAQNSSQLVSSQLAFGT